MDRVPEAPAALQVMSFNLRYPALDAHPWRTRRPVTRELLTRRAPHLIGTQEGRIRQLTSISDGLPEHYAWTGEGFKGSDRGEFTAVFYDTRRIRVEETTTLWLSPTPRIAASAFPGMAHPRTVTVLDCTDLADGRAFRFLNTHFDHKSDASRLPGVEVVRDLAVEAEQAILVGDFNVDQNGPVHARLLEGGLFADAFDPDPSRVDPGAVGGLAEACLIDTFHGYKGPRVSPDPAGTARIDWILHTPGFAPEAVDVCTDAVGGRFPSDHFPVEASLRRS